MRNTYVLKHKRTIEFNKETSERIFRTILLGFFSSDEKCKEIIPQYLGQPGFMDYPDDFVIEEIEANVDKYTDTPGEFQSSVFYLSHEYYDGEYDYISDLGYYSTKQLAESALKKFQVESEFIECLDGFCIAEYEIGKCEWTEGFFTY